MGNFCPPGKPTPRERNQVEPSRPSFDFIVRGNFIPQQNGDLKVCEEQGSTDSIFLDDGNERTDIESW